MATSPRATAAKRGDLLGIVESAYAVDAPVHAWNSQLLESTGDTLPGHRGGFACLFEIDAEGRPRFDKASTALLGIPDHLLEVVFNGVESAPPDWLSSWFVRPQGTVRCTLTSEADPNHQLRYRGRLASEGVLDGVNIVAQDLDNRGWLLSLAVGHDYRLKAAVRRNLVRVGTHVLAALRLRARMRNVREPSVEAVLSSDGRMLHSEGEANGVEARLALREAVLRVESARFGERRDEQALKSWQGLAGGRWTLLDEFRRDGSRYVVARENLPNTRSIMSLTHAERTVVGYVARGSTTKEIAYTLGLADVTIRVLLMRAVRRCGVENRRELIELWRNSSDSIASFTSES